jgi:hypothetical protein
LWHEDEAAGAVGHPTREGRLRDACGGTLGTVATEILREQALAARGTREVLLLASERLEELCEHHRGIALDALGVLEAAL